MDLFTPTISLKAIIDLDPTNEAIRNKYMEDGLHPNALGHKLFADYLAIKLEELAK